MTLNIRDIAAKAGVSVATISRAINSETRSMVNPKTLKMVDELIRKHNYTPNLAARHLSKSSTKTLGIIGPYFPGVFYHPCHVNVMAGVSDYLLNTEYQFKIILKKKEQNWDHYDFQRGERVDGLIITQWTQLFSDQHFVETMKIPSVIINDFKKGMKTFFVCGDEVSGGRQAAEFLYNLGHRRFAALIGFKYGSDSPQRLKGFAEFLETKGITINKDWILRGDYREDLAYEKCDELFKEKQKPTAIFCLNDDMAFGVLRRLKALKIRCPQDVSVMGYDNDIRGNFSQPPLTTAESSFYELGKEAARQLLNHLSSPTSSPFLGKSVFPVHLIARNSTAKPKD